MKNNNFIEGEDFYFDESGLIVMTEKYHLERGFCCGNGCRHCPFDYQNVNQEKRIELLFNRNKSETS
jgi:hypothetical protein